ncbi:MAG: MBL fold metallo-hydrolase [Rhodospirillaceae bacterium]
MKHLILGTAIVVVAVSKGAAQGHAANVKVMPLGSHDGEFCRYVRAMIFEHPDGTRILYDAGRTVAGAKDPRLGKIDVILVSHMHGDHADDRHIPAPNAGTCTKPDMSVKPVPNTSTIKIALATKAKVVTGSAMPAFLGKKLKANGGDAKNAQLVRFGANRKVSGITFTTVLTAHSNGVSPAFIGGDLGKMTGEAGIAGYAGPPTAT